MAKVFVLSFFLAVLAACAGPTPPTTDEAAAADSLATADAPPDAEPFSLRYRCDGFYNGMASEWVEVSGQGAAIAQVRYWNTADEAPQALQILSAEFHAGEISGYTGRLAFPDGTAMDFGIVEDRFNFIHPDDRMQEFFLETDF